MKTWKSIICIAVLAVAACGEKTGETKTDKPAAESGYQCPMKCTEPVAEPGKCPKCSMEMEQVSPS